MYLVLFLVGIVGFTAMTALGFLHGGGHHGGHGHGGHADIGGGHGHGLSGGHGHHGALDGGHHGIGHHGAHGHVGHGHADAAHGHHGANGHSHHPAKSGHHEQEGGLNLWSIISPLDIFSLCFGAGAAGLLLQKVIPAVFLPWAALAGAIIFNFLMVKPVMNKLLDFASKPCEGLEGSIAKSGVAATRFDENGRGLIKLVVDGQTVQVLAMLDSDEHDRGILVAKGDPLTILDVDSNRNTCRVTREMAV